MAMRTKVFLPNPSDFVRWREELGMTEKEVADAAGISVEEYNAAEQSKEAAGLAYLKVCAAFVKFGKQVPPVTADSTLN